MQNVKTVQRVLTLILLLAATASPAFAQYEPQPMEIFGGISYFDPGNFRGTPQGGQGELVINLSDKFAMVIESGFQPGTVTMMFRGVPIGQAKNFGTVQTGFRYYWIRNRRFSVFGHILTGGMFGKAQFIGDTRTRTIQGGVFTPGGGVEINITKNFAIRPIQTDLMLGSFFRGSSSVHRRFGAGFVYRFGE